MSSLPFNLQGISQSLRDSKSFGDILGTLNLLVYEFYRAIGIILYTRYLGVMSEKGTSLDKDVLDLVDNQFEKPSFDAWTKLGRVCGEHLYSLGDRFALDYSKVAQFEVESPQGDRIRAMLEIMDERRDAAKSLSLKKITFPIVLGIMTRMYDLSKAQIFYGDVLSSLINSKVHLIALDVVERIFRSVNVRLVIPMSITKERTEALSILGQDSSVATFPARSRYTRYLFASYLSYYDDEEPFQYRCGLIHYERSDSKCYLYASWKKDASTFESLSNEDGVSKINAETASLRDTFDVPDEITLSYDSYLTLSNKFGQTSNTNGIVHNLGPRFPTYVRRPNAESELFAKLSKRKFYITTLDGGGGFGKTELARTAVWDLIESDKEGLPDYLNLEYVIWMTGKREHFREGRVEISPQQLGSVEDLMDAILYVTNNTSIIGQAVDIKRKRVLDVLNGVKSTLLVLDNLETVAEKEDVWEYISNLVEEVTTEVRVLATSRVRIGSTEQVVTVRKMEEAEARELARVDMEVFGIEEKWRQEEYVDLLIKSTGSIPLLIRYSVLLISQGLDFEAIASQLPDDSDMALEFMCGLQWSTLNTEAKKLLTGIAFWDGKISFSQAKTLCSFSEDSFKSAAEQLSLRSFLVESSLVDSVLEILPPIAIFALKRLKKHPEFENEFMNNENLLRTPLLSRRATTEVNLREDVELNRIFQRAELMARQGAIYIAYDYYKQATDRFPKSVSAWRMRGEFEYRYLKDASEGNSSFRQASILDPTDAITYELWAYWEYELGVGIKNETHLERSLIVYKDAYRLSSLESDQKRITSSIAISHLALGDAKRMQIRNASEKMRKKLSKECDFCYIQAIDSLKRNLYNTPVTDEQQYHNADVYALLSQAHLSVGSNLGANRESIDDCAIFYTILGLQTDPANPRIRSYLKDPRFVRALRRHNKTTSEKDKIKYLVNLVLSLKEKVEGACLKVRLV